MQLGDVVDLVTGYPFQSQRYIPDERGVRLLRGDNIAQGNLRWDGVKRWSPDKVDGLDQYWLQKGDVVLAMDRPWIDVGLKYAPVREGDLPSLLVQRVTRLRGTASLDGGFLKFVIASQAFTDHILAVQTGTAVPHISANQIRQFTFALPLVAEQRAIADILGTLDDKIELNRKMKETLEMMARALFKSWFVDFDPVSAKAEGRDTGVPAHIAALFPDSFEDSELGEIPRGWGASSLAAFSALNPETWSNTTRPDSIEYVDLANTKWGRIEATTLYEIASAPSRAQRILRSGDTILGTVRPGNGSYALVGAGGLTGSTGFAVLRPKNRDYVEFVYLAATAPGNIDTLAHLADGAAYPAVRPEVVLSTPVAAAPDFILRSFSNIVNPLLTRLAVAEQESRALAGMRDALLPKLISGELRLSVAS